MPESQSGGVTGSDRCRACGDRSVTPLVLRENLFGTGQEFTYLRCDRCASLSIAVIPDDMSQFYPAAYFRGPLPNETVNRGEFKTWLFESRDRFAVGRGSLAGCLFFQLFPRYDLRSLVWLDPSPGQRLLDVGAGTGEWLRRLGELGVPLHLSGVDAFAPASDLVTPGTLSDISGETWDLLTFHHSLEHVGDPTLFLEQAGRVCAPGAKLLVDVPTVSSTAWARYGPDWVQLDAPRHFTLFSREGLIACAVRAGLRLIALRYASTGFQFWGSELIRYGEPLVDPAEPGLLPHQRARASFSRARMIGYEALAHVANARHRGDTLCAIFTPAEMPLR